MLMKDPTTGEISSDGTFTSTTVWEDGSYYTRIVRDGVLVDYFYMPSNKSEEN